jgi:hypothetical protein
MWPSAASSPVGGRRLTTQLSRSDKDKSVCWGCSDRSERVRYCREREERIRFEGPEFAEDEEGGLGTAPGSRGSDANPGFGAAGAEVAPVLRLNANLDLGALVALSVSIDFSNPFNCYSPIKYTCLLILTRIRLLGLTISYCFWSYVGIEPVASASVFVAFARRTESSCRTAGVGEGVDFADSSLFSSSKTIWGYR